MFRIALRNLVHDRVRLVVTLTGIVFALVLIAVQFGLFLGFLETSSNIVAQNKADIYITAPGVPHVNGGSPIPETRRYKALAVEGVENVEKYTVFFVVWKLPTGSQYLPKLGVNGLGDSVEIMGRRARIVGLTRGILSFTTSPYVFTNFKNAQNYQAMTQDQTVYLLVKAKAGQDLEQLKSRLAAAIPGVDIFTREEMRQRTMSYWVFSTGAGTTTLLGAILGLLVGIVVVAQTIYSATIDHIREFGTLKAMGARNSHIYRVILSQSVLSAVLGYIFGIGFSLLVVRASEGSNAPILLPQEAAIGIFFLTLFMCVSASFLSIRKATNIDPAMVFRG
jgi:putative ABC transport system permease protein